MVGTQAACIDFDQDYLDCAGQLTLLMSLMLSQKVVIYKFRLCLMNMLVTNVLTITLKMCICWAAPNTLMAGITGAADTLNILWSQNQRQGCIGQ